MDNQGSQRIGTHTKSRQIVKTVNTFQRGNIFVNHLQTIHHIRFGGLNLTIMIDIHGDIITVSAFGIMQIEIIGIQYGVPEIGIGYGKDLGTNPRSYNKQAKGNGIFHSF